MGRAAAVSSPPPPSAWADVVARYLEALRLTHADPTTPIGLRDRALLETGYSTGLRCMELIRLRLYDLDLARGAVVVREGKGRKDRVVPIGERAIAWLEKYLDEARSGCVVEPDEGTVFLTRTEHNGSGGHPRRGEGDGVSSNHGGSPADGRRAVPAPAAHSGGDGGRHGR
jgi:site-specific recombinase XerD